MEWITRQLAMSHLRLTEDDASGDLDQAIEGAKQIASDFLNRPIPWKNHKGKDEPVPASVVSATLLIIGALYDDREGGELALSTSARYLLWPYKRITL
jgi:hypothetical protein